MAVINWDISDANKRYEYGVDRGVIYYQGYAHPWDGLVRADFKRSSGVLDPIYYEGVRFDVAVDTYEVLTTIESYTYPALLDALTGVFTDTLGVEYEEFDFDYFAMTYRTMVNQDDYKIRILLKCYAKPLDSSHNTVDSTLNPTLFKWDLTTIPTEVNGYLSPSITIDSTKVPKPFLKQAEDFLYGTSTANPNIPALLALVHDYMTHQVTDNGDGSWSLLTTEDYVTMSDNNTMFSVESTDNEFLNLNTYNLTGSQNSIPNAVTITGLTAARMYEIENKSIVSGSVSNGDLILTNYGGVSSNAGNVRGPQGIPGVMVGSDGVVQHDPNNISLKADAHTSTTVNDVFLIISGTMASLYIYDMKSSSASVDFIPSGVIPAEYFPVKTIYGSISTVATSSSAARTAKVVVGDGKVRVENVDTSNKLYTGIVSWPIKNAVIKNEVIANLDLPAIQNEVNYMVASNLGGKISGVGINRIERVYSLPSETQDDVLYLVTTGSYKDIEISTGPNYVSGSNKGSWNPMSCRGRLEYVEWNNLDATKAFAISRPTTANLSLINYNTGDVIYANTTIPANTLVSPPPGSTTRYYKFKVLSEAYSIPEFVIIRSTNPADLYDTGLKGRWDVSSIQGYGSWLTPLTQDGLTGFKFAHSVKANARLEKHSFGVYYNKGTTISSSIYVIPDAKYAGLPIRFDRV